MRLASASWDNTVKVWETASVPVEVLRQREEVSRQQELADRIRSMVRSLFDKLVLRSDVIASLRKDTTLSDTERAFAVRVAQTYTQNPNSLNAAAWDAVRDRTLTKEAYAVALRQARAAADLVPGDGNTLNTLGVAQYRVGQYKEALATLTKSEKLNTIDPNGSQPADLAFLAMAQYRLGQKEQAQATLARLWEVMKQPRWANNDEAQGFLSEAERTLKAKP
jgi:tetratricopeptide (TPR) repeat protein